MSWYHWRIKPMPTVPITERTESVRIVQGICGPRLRIVTRATEFEVAGAARRLGLHPKRVLDQLRADGWRG